MSLRTRSRRLATGCPSVMRAGSSPLPRCAPGGALVSSSARLLYRQMIDKADYDGYVSLGATVMVSVARQRAGMSSDASSEIAELLVAGWIEAHLDGGWNLREGVTRKPGGG